MPVARRSPTVILLVRHGKTPTTGKVLPGRAKGLSLSEEGLAQARAVANRIAALAETTKAKPSNRRAFAVYASPLERTMQTAHPISRALGLRTRSAKGLLECDFGRWTGQELDGLRKRPEWQAVQRLPSSFRFPGGESFAEMQLRVNSAIADISTRHAGSTVVAVSHADPIKSVLAAALGIPLDLFQRISVSPCSVSAIAYSDDGPHVLSINSTGSLRELGIS